MLFVFLPAIGQFVISDLLGGGKTWMLGNLIEQQFRTSRDWPFGSAVSMAALAFMIVGLGVSALLNRSQPTANTTRAYR
jgi:spermidine/putrescine transport system permease protein